VKTCHSTQTTKLKSGKARYFVLKTPNSENIELSRDKTVWSATEHVNKILSSAFEASKTSPVILFFSVEKRFRM
jgi:hypothetical protein